MLRNDSGKSNILKPLLCLVFWVVLCNIHPPMCIVSAPENLIWVNSLVSSYNAHTHTHIYLLFVVLS